ncbi:hypothetical protein TRL7639_01186 [Falsiruegeria litorea R37]|uniref:Uncharacterized protein n=1 Tax=Falsiruegeria litorea R37 TaxID=1200284 RepID=A0A1Y5S1V4_9RHOB|nr:hypothetical protein TRL7639_01186 [Falsiruegeria litorea R37]
MRIDVGAFAPLVQKATEPTVVALSETWTKLVKPWACPNLREGRFKRILT